MFENVGIKPPKLLIFGINLPQRGISPYAIFTKCGVGEGVPSSHPHTKFHHRDFKNVDFQPKNRQKW